MLISVIIYCLSERDSIELVGYKAILEECTQDAFFCEVGDSIQISVEEGNVNAERPNSNIYESVRVITYISITRLPYIKITIIIIYIFKWIFILSSIFFLIRMPF